jgi:hypothetical protein
MPRLKIGDNNFLKTNVQCVVNEKLYFVTSVEIVLKQVAHNAIIEKKKRFFNLLSLFTYLIMVAP